MDGKETHDDGLSALRLRELLRDGGSLTLGKDAASRLASGEFGKEYPDIQWMYDCAMEEGNSTGSIVLDGFRRPEGVVFSNAGTCTVGIVCEVRFRIFGRFPDKRPLYPEDIAGREGAELRSVELSYDACYDEEEDE